MAKRQIRLSTDELLRKKSKEVREITPSVITLLDDMAETMYHAEGVGLAAPQVGVLRRVVVIDIGQGLIELINPVVLETKGMQVSTEGCLSVPGTNGKVERPAYIRVKALNRQGKAFTIEGTELMAVALCHEIDHLDGILYIDKALPEEEEETK